MQSSGSSSYAEKRTTNRNGKFSPPKVWNETPNGSLFPDDRELTYCHIGLVPRLALTCDQLPITNGRSFWRFYLTDFSVDRWETTTKKIRISSHWVFTKCDEMPWVSFSMACKPRPWTELRDRDANPKVKHLRQSFEKSYFVLPILLNQPWEKNIWWTW
jgi:hypothetical protein